jgi:hypothetical protein
MVALSHVSASSTRQSSSGPTACSTPPSRARRLVLRLRDGVGAVAERAGGHAPGAGRGRRYARGEGGQREVGGGERVAGVDGGRVRGQARVAEPRVQRARAAAAHELRLRLPRSAADWRWCW